MNAEIFHPIEKENALAALIWVISGTMTRAHKSIAINIVSGCGHSGNMAVKLALVYIYRPSEANYSPESWDYRKLVNFILVR